MIVLLRRVTQHFQEQNWFAVLIDFAIVVVGVFVGLQVQDWNDVRKERLEEQELLNRLHTETLELLESNQDELDGLGVRASILAGANPVLFSQEEPRAITPAECGSIAGSHVLRRPTDELPVLDEMLETGRFDLLQNQATKENLRNYVLLRERARAHYGEAINELFRLHSRFPSMIVVKRVPKTTDSDVSWGGLSGAGYEWSPECDVEKMTASTAFLNEYADNVSRIATLTGFVVRRRDHLIELERILAGAIGDERRQN